MNGDLLTLKNIYRVLTDDTYPEASYPVFSLNSKRGLTLNVFWQDILLKCFKENKYGHMIFRQEGPRCRFFSQICNRADDIHFYDDYAYELDQVMGPDIFRRQAGEIALFLRAHDFSYEVLIEKLEIFLRRIAAGDPYIDDELQAAFNSVIAIRHSLDESDFVRQSEYCGGLLACLTVGALYGKCTARNRRNDEIISYLDNEYAQTYRPGVSKSVRAANTTEIITNKKSSLWTRGTAYDCFCGREYDFFNVEERMRSGGKHLICGQGGIGKTELVKRFMFEVLRKNLADAIATVSYHGSITESLIDAFRLMPVNIKQDDVIEQKEGTLTDDEGRIDEIMAYLRSYEGKKLFLFLDDIDLTFVKDPLYDEFMALPITVFATSRYFKMKGFNVYELELLDPKACEMIFRNAYKRDFTPEERVRTAQFFQDSRWRHTQTVVLLARSASSHDIPPVKIFERADDMAVRNLQDIYKSMYSLGDLTNTEKLLLGFIAWSHAQIMDVSVVYDYADIGDCSYEACITSLERLSDLGWITVDKTTVSIRPFMAECVTKMIKREKVYGRLVEKLKKEWVHDAKSDTELYLNTKVRARSNSSMIITMADIITAIYTGKAATMDEVEKKLFLGAADIAIKSHTVLRKEVLDTIEAVMESVRDNKALNAVCMIEIILASREQPREIGQEKLIEEELANPTLPTAIMTDLLLGLLGERGFYSSFEKSIERAQWVISHAIRQDDIAMADGILASLFWSTNRRKEALEHLKHGRKIATEPSIKFEMAYLSEMYSVQHHDLTTAERDLREMEDIVRKARLESRFDISTRISTCKGLLYRESGNPEEALREIKHALELTALWRTKNTIDYNMLLAEYANVLEKADRFEESEVAYLEVIKYFEKLPEGQMTVGVLRSNMAVSFIRRKMPEKALECLDIAKENMVGTGHISEAELFNNYSRAYELLGDYDKCVEYAEKAYPQMAEVYGPNDKKCIENRERVKKR